MEFRRFDTDRDGDISTHEKFVGLAKYGGDSTSLAVAFSNLPPEVPKLKPTPVKYEIPVHSSDPKVEDTPRTQIRNRGPEAMPRLSLRGAAKRCYVVLKDLPVVLGCCAAYFGKRR